MLIASIFFMLYNLYTLVRYSTNMAKFEHWDAVHAQVPIRESIAKLSTPAVVHLVYALHGQGHEGLYQEFEVSLKSALLQAPLDADLHVHVVANKAGVQALPAVWERTQIQTWRTRNQVIITVYNIESRLESWLEIYHQAMPAVKQRFSYLRHSFGAFYRLVLDTFMKDVGMIVYADTDVVFLANLQDVPRSMRTISNNTDPLFAWGSTRCSGFMLLNVKQLPQLRGILHDVQDAVASKAVWKSHFGDQLLLREVASAHPNRVALLPSAWDISMADGVPTTSSEQVVRARPAVGMMHFNGGGTDLDAFFVKHKNLKDFKFAGTFGLVHGIVRMPWTWARFMAETQIGSNEGHPLKIETVVL